MTVMQDLEMNVHQEVEYLFVGITAELQFAESSGLVSDVVGDRILAVAPMLALPQLRALHSIVSQLANDPVHGLAPIWDETPPLIPELRELTDPCFSPRGGRRPDDIHKLVYGSPELQHALEMEAGAIIKHGGLDGTRRGCQALRDLMND